MRLGIMQPYFFPYLGYFELIDRVDRWVVFDNVNYSPRSWMNRNRVLHPKKGWYYISIPIKKSSQHMELRSALVNDKTMIKQQLLGKLTHYRKYAPFYFQILELVEETFLKAETDLLLDLNLAGLITVCDYLDLSFNWCLSSELKMDFQNIEHAGQWALEISSFLGADEYINLPSGKAIFKMSDWQEKGIKITFLEISEFSYYCAPYTFEPHLSILDVLMWVPAEAVKKAIKRKINHYGKQD